VQHHAYLPNECDKRPQSMSLMATRIPSEQVHLDINKAQEHNDCASIAAHRA